MNAIKKCLKYIGIGLAVCIVSVVVFCYAFVLIKIPPVKSEPKVVEPTIHQCVVVSERGQVGLLWYAKVAEEQLWTAYSKIIVQCNKQTKQICVINSCKIVKELPDAETLDALKKEMQKQQKEKSKIYT